MKKLNLQIRDIFIILLAGLLIWQIFFTNNNSTKEIIKPVIVNIPEKIGDHRIFESPYIESGKAIFVNSDKINNYGY